MKIIERAAEIADGEEPARPGMALVDEERERRRRALEAWRKQRGEDVRPEDQ